ncbi:MAG TPA: carboxypeptidase regulatory-like domain-containing protein [Bryobacteraceae bacterium]|nr:carboxypeptidase regulatory-like domain-containing protein [Bryobacteraceae bacterium]
MNKTATLGVKLCVLGALVAAGIGVPLYAQAVASAQISGLVTDPSGSAVSGATVTATQTDTHTARSTVSSGTGSYVIPNLPVGPYTIEVTAPGFAKYTQKGIVLAVAANVSIPVMLPVGSVKQEIQVTANATMVEQHDTAVSNVIDDKRVLELPLNGRQVTSLVLLSGAAANASRVGDMVGSKTYGSANIAGSTAISVAGGQANSTNFMMDGGDNNHNYSNVNLPFPFPDAVQEFSVQTSGLSARYGLHPGGTMNVVTKSGTNQFHGDLFEFLRNGDLNARNFFAATHDSLKRNQFGGTIGGPVLRDRLFFFFGYQGTRVRSAPPQTISYVPTTAALGGDFSQLESAGCQSSGKSKTIINPATGQPFPNAMVPLTMLNPQALALTKYLPASSSPCGQITYAIPSPEGENQYIGRGDWVISAKQTLFARYFNTSLANPAAPFDNNLLLTGRAGLADSSESFVVGDTYSLSPTMLNSLHLTGTKIRVNRSPQADDINPGTVGLNISSLASNFLYMSISGYFNIGCGSCAPAVYASGSVQLADDFDIIRGRHHLSFGADYIYNQLNEDNVFLGNGYWIFNGQASGDGLVDFLLGTPSTYQQGNPALGNPRQAYIGIYGQDDFQVTPHLQLHFGLRWEPFLPAADTLHRIDHFSPAAFAAGTVSSVYVNAPPGLSFFGDPGVPDTFTSRKMDDFEPRVGFAWDPTGSGRQTIRSSYSIFYDSPELNYSTHPGQGAPWGSTVTLPSPAGGLTNPFAGYPGGNPFPSPAVPTSNQAFPSSGAYYNIPLSLQPTYTQEWDLSYQRQVGSNWLFTATYIGDKTTHSWVETEENPGVYVPGTCNGKACSTTANLNQRRVLYLQNPVAGALYSTMALSDGGANSEYNGLLVSARRRLSNNYTILANYTYSHCISEANFVGELAGPGYQNPYDRDADRGNCAFDLRHTFNLSVVATSPEFTGRRWARMLLSNWQIAPIISAHSGSPFTPLTGVDNSATGVGLDRPNVLGSPYANTANELLWLSPASFTPNPAGTFGNAGAYSLVGPSYFDIDLAISRTFAVHEAQHLEVRAEAFNSTNHVALANPVATENNSHFGQITAAGDPRILQFALKYQF